MNESLTIGDGNSGTITFSSENKTLTIEDNAIVNQDLTTDSNVTFATLSVNNSGLKISDGSHDLIIATAADLTADKTLTITTGDSDRTITLGGNLTTQNNNLIVDVSGGERTLTIEGDTLVNQDLTTDATPVFNGIKLTNGAGDGYILTSDANGNSSWSAPIPTDKITEGNTEIETVDTGSDGHIKFTTEGTERMRINKDGNMSLGVDTSDQRLKVQGTMRIQSDNTNYGDFEINNGDLKISPSGNILIQKTGERVFQVKNNDGNDVFVVDTTNNKIVLNDLTLLNNLELTHLNSAPTNSSGIAKIYSRNDSHIHIITHDGKDFDLFDQFANDDPLEDFSVEYWTIDNELTSISTFLKVGIGLSVPQNGNLVSDDGIVIGLDSLSNKISPSSVGNSSATLYIGNKTIDVSVPSDERLKDIIGISDRKSILENINVYDFKWKKEYSDDEDIQTGCIAQEIEKIDSHYVETMEDGIKRVKYNEFIPVLIDGYNELKNENKDLKERLRILEEKMSKILESI